MLFHSVYLDRLLTLLTCVTKPPVFDYCPLHKKVPILILLICHLVHINKCHTEL